jgi:hypothetical protein
VVEVTALSYKKYKETSATIINLIIHDGVYDEVTR